jgi:DeoR/GlpR family transcriptional regulator of sugar metabolism
MMRLLEYVNEQPRAVPVSELAELASREFGVSEVTLRSDLSALCALSGLQKLARGTYGACRSGASAGEGGSLFATRLQLRSESKIAIGAVVAGILARQSDLRVLLLDAGTTTYYVADRLSELAGLDLIVWTSSVAAASRLAGARGVSVRLLGGEYQAEYAAVAGDETARALRSLAGPAVEQTDLMAPLPQFAGTHSVLDVNYVSPDGRLYTDESKERLQKRLMAELGEELTLVADHSKLLGQRLGLLAHEVFALAQFQEKRTVRLVTDGALTPEQRQGVCKMFETALPRAELKQEERSGAVVFTACPRRRQ